MVHGRGTSYEYGTTRPATMHEIQVDKTVLGFSNSECMRAVEESKCAIVWYKNLTVLIEISFGYM